MSSKRFLDHAYAVGDDEETRRLYDEWSDSYDRELVDANDYRQPVRCAAALAANLPERAAPVLDVGCGTGLSGLALAEVGYTTLDGCDLSAKMLDKARLTGCYRRLFEANLNKPPLAAADEAYAAATAVGVFSFGHVQPAAVEAILRLLRPGAPLVIGLNEKFHAEGSLAAKLEALASAGALEQVSAEHGEHLPGIGLGGWVLVVRKR